MDEQGPTGLPDQTSLFLCPVLEPHLPPSPLTGNIDDLLSLFIAPAEYELIPHNTNKATDGSTIMSKPYLPVSTTPNEHQYLPLNIVGTGNLARDTNLSYCYVWLCSLIASGPHCTHHQSLIYSGDGNPINFKLSSLGMLNGLLRSNGKWDFFGFTSLALITLTKQNTLAFATLAKHAKIQATTQVSPNNLIVM